MLLARSSSDVAQVPLHTLLTRRVIALVWLHPLLRTRDVLSPHPTRGTRGVATLNQSAESLRSPIATPASQELAWICHQLQSSWLASSHEHARRYDLLLRLRQLQQHNSPDLTNVFLELRLRAGHTTFWRRARICHASFHREVDNGPCCLRGTLSAIDERPPWGGWGFHLCDEWYDYFVPAKSVAVILPLADPPIDFVHQPHLREAREPPA